MRTKIVYSVVSTPDDTYLEQTLLSIYSLRKYNPEAFVALVVDEGTNESLVGTRSAIREYVNEVITVHVPEKFNSNMLRSRYLKTSLRSYVKGDMLFIDSDTVVCGSLAEIDQLDCELGMVPDLNGQLPLTEKMILERCETAGFGDMSGKPYFNSGVIFAKDTEKVREFYNDWFCNWEQSMSKGVKYDQPALCATNAMHEGLVKEISGIWNCQYKMEGYQYLKKAKIMHYYSNNGDKESFFTLPLDTLLLRIKKTGKIDDVIGKLLGNPTRDFYAVTTITEKQWMEYVYSHQMYLSTNRPSLYGKLKIIGNWFEKILYR